jgi:dehydrogenase/reductase SDR family protein 12
MPSSCYACHSCLLQELARRGATLYMVCRSEERGRQALEKVKAESGNSNVHLAVSACRKLCSASVCAGDCMIE